MPIYLALGDSITTGYGVKSNVGFTSLYYRYLNSWIPEIKYTNCGINGVKTDGLNQLIQTNYELQQMIVQAIVITITIGSNDLMSIIKSALGERPSNISAILNNMSTNFNNIGQTIRFYNPHTFVQVASIYNPLPAGPYWPHALEAQQVIGQANKLLAHLTKNHNFSLIYLDKTFHGQEKLFIGPDHFHPSVYGHRIIADQFALQFINERVS